MEQAMDDCDAENGEGIADSRRKNGKQEGMAAAPARYRVGAVRRSRSRPVFRALRINRQTVPVD